MAIPVEDIDFEHATDVFISGFPDNSLTEILEQAENTAAAFLAVEELHDAVVLIMIAQTIRRRLAN